jgi:hypothetical protein
MNLEFEITNLEFEITNLEFEITNALLLRRSAALSCLRGARFLHAPGTRFTRNALSPLVASA